MTDTSFDIIITTFRRPDYVVAAIKSCLIQGEHLANVIVVDDASGDDTGQRIADLLDSRVKYYLRPENGGIFSARHTGLAISKADWTIHLDDDWELLSGALDVFSKLAKQAPINTVMLGARMVWDHGGESPLVVPQDPIDYGEQIRWRSRRDGLWMDNLCAIARTVRERENWTCSRAGTFDTLFYLNAARHGLTVYTSQTLALQRSSQSYSVSRGSASERLARRKMDAPGGIEVAEDLMTQHGAALRHYGPTLAAHILATKSMYHLILHARSNALKCACQALAVNICNYQAWWIVVFSILGTRAFEWAYTRRG